MKINSQIKSLGQQAGYTLIELAIAISIISVLVVSALFGVQKIIDNNNVNATSQQVSLATTNIAKFAAMLSDKTFIKDTNVAANLGIWPDNILTKGGTGQVTNVANPFGGNFYTASNSAAVGAVAPANGYYIYITNVPDKVCAAVAGMFGASTWEIRVADEAAAVAMPAAAVSIAAGTAVKVAGTDRINLANLNSACGSVAARKTVYLFYPL
ncbi:hypothetical protein C5F52_08310 [Limnohabitans sp. TS-CS-82]|uniref:type II secretion system protein n=1 Tax=Limnohabitans sp. TS-CS-82 TaxID=2094193 RepID=UPI000CF281A7|nr:type 4 pilus major pilin [Limnohabitans sp. TS-CS-82]PQA83443.1 hypothetical protein C5F52_08310 [Limnohabitans sp. TS-CS-82]